jgi:hypothetical protein
MPRTLSPAEIRVWRDRSRNECRRGRSARLRHPGHGPQRPRQVRPAKQRIRPDRSCRDEAAQFSRLRQHQADIFAGGTSTDGKPKPGFQVANHNTLLHNSTGAIGIKNGYTVAAKFAYIEAATRAGKTYLLTEMASPDGGRHPAAAMLDRAFVHGPTVAPIGALVDPGDPVLPSQPRRQGFVPSRYRPIRLVCRLARLLSPPESPWRAGSEYWPSPRPSHAAADAAEPLSVPGETSHGPNAAGQHCCGRHRCGPKNEPGPHSRTVAGTRTKRR